MKPKTVWERHRFSQKTNERTFLFAVKSKNANTVKLGNKERFDKEQIGIKELIMD
jgi:hypothetical protein